ncbi:MAG: T9SS type A sorting domain-containing protein [Rhodothermales bacterium]
MSTTQRLLAILFVLLCPGLVFAQEQITVTDSDIPAESTVTWLSGNTYILDGIVFVDSAATLIIEPGTVIKGMQGAGNDASGLVVTRYAQIQAEGTAESPIIFTSALDPLDGSLTFADRGLWGGVVILGRASTNNQTQGGLKEIEGVNELTGEGDTRATYGGNEDTHSSGVFRYVSIRHTGINVGDQAGNEIQGLTLGGVGSGTVVEYVESFASADDGFEWFGGTVNTKYLVSAFNEDDSYDWDEGFRGKGQFWFAIQADDKGGRTAEQDGATGNEFFQPYATPKLSNVTYIGPNAGIAEGDGAEMLIFRDNTGGNYYNSIFTEYTSATGGAAITIEDIDNTGDRTEDSRTRLESGDLNLMNNLWWGFGNNSMPSVAPQDFVQDYLSDVSNGNSIVDPALRGISRVADGVLDPRPEAGGAAWGNTLDTGDDFFDTVDYKGAFGEDNWLLSWTALNELGHLNTDTGVGIETLSEEVPDAFALAQNFPNPFNPSTTIEFQVSQAQHIELRVFDVLGHEVAVLANEVTPAGTYSLQFDATDFASGMYFYQLKGLNTTVTKTMLLLK